MTENAHTGIVFGIQRLSIHDGPGIRTTVFLKGCNVNCKWCHNPEGIPMQPLIGLNQERCVRCGACAAVCPQKIAIPDELAAFAAELDKLPSWAEVCKARAEAERQEKASRGL